MRELNLNKIQKRLENKSRDLNKEANKKDNSKLFKMANKLSYANEELNATPIKSLTK